MKKLMILTMVGCILLSKLNATTIVSNSFLSGSSVVISDEMNSLFKAQTGSDFQVDDNGIVAKESVVISNEITNSFLEQNGFSIPSGRNGIVAKQKPKKEYKVLRYLNGAICYEDAPKDPNQELMDAFGMEQYLNEINQKSLLFAQAGNLILTIDSYLGRLNQFKNVIKTHSELKSQINNMKKVVKSFKNNKKAKKVASKLDNVAFSEAITYEIYNKIDSSDIVSDSKNELLAIINDFNTLNPDLHQDTYPKCTDKPSISLSADKSGFVINSKENTDIYYKPYASNEYSLSMPYVTNSINYFNDVCHNISAYGEKDGVVSEIVTATFKRDLTTGEYTIAKNESCQTKCMDFDSTLAVVFKEAKMKRDGQVKYHIFVINTHLDTRASDSEIWSPVIYEEDDSGKWIVSNDFSKQELKENKEWSFQYKGDGAEIVEKTYRVRFVFDSCTAMEDKEVTLRANDF